MVGLLQNFRASLWSFFAILRQYGLGVLSWMTPGTLRLREEATPLRDGETTFAKEDVDTIINETNETNELREYQAPGNESNEKTWTPWNDDIEAGTELPKPAVEEEEDRPNSAEVAEGETGLPCPIGGLEALWDNKTEAPTPAAATKQTAWWVNLGSWVRMDNDTQEMLRQARAEGKTSVEFQARGQPYRIDFEMGMQINTRTMMCREIKETEEDEVPEEDEEESDEDEDVDEDDLLSKLRAGAPTELPKREERLENLVNLLLSEGVQVPLPAEATEEKEKLSQEEVKKVFKDHVPGVQKFLFRDQPGQYSLNFLATAYSGGLRAFSGTAMENHLKWLMRTIVHYGHDNKPGAARYLKEVAEAFLDCQAVQARVVERTGLEILGVRQDFRGLVKALIGDYKVMAIKMLAMDHLSRHVVSDDGNPTHYENRLTADLGKVLGLNEDDIRRADLDEHARNRFGKLQGNNRDDAAKRCRQLFDVEAMIKTFCNEVNSFNAETCKDSLPGQFMTWADENMTQKHAIFDEDTCSKVEVTEILATAIFEVLFNGKPAAPQGETYRDTPISELFKVQEVPPTPPPPPPKAKAKAHAKGEGKSSGQALSKGDGKGISPKAKKQRTKR
ncbi:SLC30A9 [Symbiodinium natans]|uniref:SLC30A9 protein n=1 Tax=Symbiodinium natans TaxID=878477 RepID=A0A812MAA9_9DINO|nr:SLC30A9 [Symbiodinium natans]